MNKIQITHEWLKNNLTAAQYTELHVEMAKEMCMSGLYKQLAADIQQLAAELRNKNAKSD